MSESNRLLDGFLHGKYRILRIIGQGGFGRTFLAEDVSAANEPRCVIKQFFSSGSNSSDQAAALFRLEAQRLKELGNHLQIPKLLEYFEVAGNQYIAQEFVDGQNLEQELAQNGAFTEVEIRSLLQELLPVLQFIHEHQVIHRDIKPENIIRRGDRTLVLVDFGAAKYASETVLAKTGTMIGSAEYVAPEQAMGKAVFQSDLYSLGVTSIHLLTQIPPFDLMDYGEGGWFWRDYLRQPVSHQLGDIIDKLLERGTKRRYQSAAEVLADLAESQRAIFTPVVENKRRFLSNKVAAVAVSVLITVGAGVGGNLLLNHLNSVFDSLNQPSTVTSPQNAPHTYKSPSIKPVPHPRSPNKKATESSKDQFPIANIVPLLMSIVRTTGYLVVFISTITALVNWGSAEDPRFAIQTGLIGLIMLVIVNLMFNLLLPGIEQVTTTPIETTSQ